jgi:hypothetical protein
MAAAQAEMLVWMVPVGVVYILAWVAWEAQVVCRLVLAAWEQKLASQTASL